jgi:hypothetical protein
MKTKIVFLLIIVFTLNGCVAEEPTTTTLEKALASYEEFLNAREDAISYKEPTNEPGKRYTININSEDVWGGHRGEDFAQYALFDMNGDQIPELHVRGGIKYNIFTYLGNQLLHWYIGSTYENPTNDRAILYTRHGAAPKHMSYQYTILDFWGNTLLCFDFQKFVHVEEREGMRYQADDYDENGQYVFDGVEVSKSQWDALTERYLTSTSDLIIWKNPPAKGEIVLAILT